MAKAPAQPLDSSALRAIPSVERILSAAAFAPLVGEFGRERVKDAVVGHLAVLRLNRTPYDETGAVAAAEGSLTAATRCTLRRTINGSGVIIHTNLGRAP